MLVAKTYLFALKLTVLGYVLLLCDSDMGLRTATFSFMNESFLLLKQHHFHKI